MAEDEDALITIVDVTDPDDPSYGDIKTRRRALTDAELKTLKPMLEKVGAYKFFSMEFNFADGPAVKQFIDTVQLEEYKRSKQRKNVQESMKGMVAGREVVIDSDLIERALGLVDDGEPIIKPKGETSGLHTFYIKPKFVDLCQNYRGVYLKLFKSEYSYFVNLTHQIQSYCCGGSHENQITLTQYRAVDLMIRGKPVNWNRYLLQNFQDKLRKYKSGPCALYFGGTLTALIYKALQVDYNLVNKPLLISPGTPERNPVSDGETPSKQQQQQRKSTGKSKSASKAAAGSGAVTPYQGPPSTGKREVLRRTEGAVTRAQRMLAVESLSQETEPATGKSSKSAKQASSKRKRDKDRGDSRRGKAKAQRKETDSEPSGMEAEETEEEETAEEQDEMPCAPIDAFTPGSGALEKRYTEAERLGNELVLSVKPSKVTGLYAQATGSLATSMKSLEPLELTASKELWRKYEQIYMAQHEFQLEHIVSKQMLEQSQSRVEELESLLKEKEEALKDKEQALKDRDETIEDKERRVSELESSITALEKRLDEVMAARTAAGSEDGYHSNNNGHKNNNSHSDKHPFKVRLKTQTKASEQVASQQRDVEADGGEQAGEGREQAGEGSEQTDTANEQQQQQQEKQGEEEQDKQKDDQEKELEEDKEEEMPDKVAESV